MFRSKRSALVKRLWRNRVLQNEGDSAPETSSTEDPVMKSASYTMLKRLKEKHLDTLVQSVESKGGETTECVLLPRESVRLGKRSVPPHLLCCQIWRWPSLEDACKLKRLPCCVSREEGFICCNPYHWSLLYVPDMCLPVSSGSEIQRVHLSPEPEGPEEDPVSTETGLTPTARMEYTDGGSSPGGGSHWCSIAYWEHRQRIGRLYTVHQPSIHVFQQLPHGDGMCLQVLQPANPDESVRRTREKIGLGVTLSKEGEEVWAYNRSQFPVFVNSPTLELPNTRTLVVRKLLAGHCVKIYDMKEAAALERVRDRTLLDGPYDPCSIRLSFAKGWGPCYSRQFVTSCPCWLEILLNVHR